MDFAFSEREDMLRKAVREFAENEIPPKMEAMEETGDFPTELLKPMADLGITGVITPAEYGGVGLGYVARTIVLEELGRVCGAMPMGMQVHHMACANLMDFANDAQKAKYLPPLAKGETMGCVAVTDPAGGSDLVGMKATAELKGDTYILNGRKCFITNSHTADFWIIIAKTADGAKGLSAFIVEKDFPGAKAARVEHKFGLRGANTGELAFDNCEVPKENLLGQEGGGLAVALKTISEVGRTGMAAAALGILTAVYEEAAKFASERILYGKPISALQGIQFPLAEIYSQLEICRLLVYRAAWMKDNNMRMADEAALAKYYTCEQAANMAKKAIEIHGAYGIMKEYPVQRLLRDAIVTISAGGTAEIAKVVLARKALAPFKK
ncbi:MAG: acyl-CoA dehydrogenase family protein [Deltaproteobacteria bacterium]|nr:acyl-CoA dehydrogenase family protein [Deltaproteobacteria bacterium]